MSPYRLPTATPSTSVWRNFVKGFEEFTIYDLRLPIEISRIIADRMLQHKPPSHLWCAWAMGHLTGCDRNCESSTGSSFRDCSRNGGPRSSIAHSGGLM